MFRLIYPLKHCVFYHVIPPRLESSVRTEDRHRGLEKYYSGGKYFRSDHQICRGKHADWINDSLKEIETEMMQAHAGTLA